MAVEQTRIKQGIEVDRVIGKRMGTADGPTVVFVAGIHGNEPTGVQALQKAFSILEQSDVPIHGRVYGLVGNLTALRAGKRFHEQDLNRIWTAERMPHLEQTNEAPDQRPDSLEQVALYREIKTIFREANGPFLFIDLHTTSSETSPFIAINDTLINRHLAQRYPVPAILGIEEYIHGPMLNYISEIGHPCLVFEAGQHTSPASLDHHHAFIWLSLVFAGILDRDKVSGYDRYFKRLRTAAGQKRGMFDIRHREAIGVGEVFEMEPGFVNFQAIDKGELLAQRQGRAIHSDMNGSVFMPLYQSQGDDGFFIIRRIPNFWLSLSAGLRKYQFDRLLALLPGVRFRKGSKHVLEVDLRMARILAVELFHLLGYRKKEYTENKAFFSKREYDTRQAEGTSLS